MYPAHAIRAPDRGAPTSLIRFGSRAIDAVRRARDGPLRMYPVPQRERCPTRDQDSSGTLFVNLERAPETVDTVSVLDGSMTTHATSPSGHIAPEDGAMS